MIFTLRSRVLAAAVLLLALPIAGSASAMLLESPFPPVPLAAERTPHPVITIQEDADLCKPGSGVVNCGSADGASWSTAYKIQGWEITATTTAPALTLTSLTKYVIVTGNVFTAHEDGTVSTVVIANNRNVAFENNRVSGSGGPALEVTRVNDSTRVNDNLFTQATPGPGTHALVDVLDAHGLRITDNTLRSADGAWNGTAELLRVDMSNRVALDGNRYGPINGTGLRLADGSNVTSANETYNTTRTGVVAVNSDDLNVADVTMDGVLDGVRVYESTGVVLTSSSITDNWPCDYGCSATGIYAEDSAITVDGVLVESFDDGIVLVDSTSSSSSTSTDDGTSTDTASSESTLKGRYVTLRGNENGVQIFGGTKVMLKWSNIEGNGVGIRNNGGRVVGATHNWWGCNAGPGASGCDSVVGDVDWAPPSSSRFPSA